MSSTARVTLSSDDVRHIVGDIASAFLFASAEPAGDGAVDADDVVAVVRLGGAFTGSVVCATSMEFAALCASRMLAVAPEVVDEEAVRDAVGEITNMIAGSIKALLPEPSTLSLPTVALGGGAATAPRDAATVAAVPLRCAGQPLRVAVLAHG